MANLNLNKVILGGRMARDPEVKETQNGKKVASFCVAVNRMGEKGESDFFNVTAWNKTAELVAGYFHKGSSIALCGRIQTRKYKDKEGKDRTATDIVADEVYFVDSRNESATDTATATAPAQAVGQGDYMADRYANIATQMQAPPQQQQMGENSYTLDDSEDLPF